MKLNHNIGISGGLTSKRHILSPIELRLAQFITCLNDIRKTKVNYSFHTETEKYSIRPILDFTKKKAKEKIIDKLKNEKNVIAEVEEDLERGKTKSSLVIYSKEDYSATFLNEPK